MIPLFLIHHSSLLKMLHCFYCHSSVEIGGGCSELTPGVHSSVRQIYSKALQVKVQDKLNSLFHGR